MNVPGKGVKYQLDKQFTDKAVAESLAAELAKDPNMQSNTTSAPIGQPTVAPVVPAVTGTPATPAPTINQNETKVPSDSGTPAETVKLKMPDGRELAPDQVLEEYKNLQKDYTVKSQELSQLKKSPTQPQSNGSITPENANNQGQSQLSPADQAIIAELKRHNVVFQSDLPKTEEIIAKSAQVAQSNVELNSILDELSTDFNGATVDVNGRQIQKPKVEKKEIMDFIVQNPNTNLSPLQIAKFLHVDDFVKFEAASLVGQGSPNLPQTENAGAAVTQPPAPSVFKFQDGSAERGVREILSQAKG